MSSRNISKMYQGRGAFYVWLRLVAYVSALKRIHSAMTIQRTPDDFFPTLTSTTQAETEEVLLKHLPKLDSEESKDRLQKNSHLQFLVRNIRQGFPARYVSQDASQPWLLYWTLEAFSILQVGLDPGNKQK